METPHENTDQGLIFWLSQGRRPYIFILIIITLLTYTNSLSNGFAWDDESQIVNNPLLKNFSNIKIFWTGSTFYGGGSENLLGFYYRPVTTTFFSFLVSLFGAAPFAFHIASLLLHGLNSILVFFLFGRFFSKRISFLLAALFLVHPIHTEVVDYASGLGDLISFSFGATAFLLFTAQRKIRVRILISAIALFLCSLLAKETGLIFIMSGFIYRILFYKESRTSIKVPVIAIIFYAFLRSAFSNIQANTQNFVPIMTVSPVEKLLSLPKIIVYYIHQFFFPVNIATSQHWVVRIADMPNFYIPFFELSSFIGILVTLYFFTKKYTSEITRALLFSASLLILGLAAHSHIISLFATVADRWFYVPSIGMIGILGVCLTIFSRKASPSLLKVGLLLFLFIIFLFALRTFARNLDWKDAYTLYSHDLLTNPSSYELENNLGQEFYRQGNLEEAKKHFERSINLTKDNWIALNNLGTIYFRQNDIAQARKLYQQVVDESDLYLAHENLARILILYDTPEATKEFTTESLKKFPYNAKLWGILAMAESRLHNKNEALKAAQEAYGIDPNKLNSTIYQKASKGEEIW